MSTTWDLRDILSINPELDTFTCVIDQDSVDYGCQNLVDSEDRAAMVSVLDGMDMSMSHAEVSKSIEELASRARCMAHQNMISDQHPSQLDCLSSEWVLLFQERWIAMNREKSLKDKEEFRAYEMNQTLEQIRVMIDQVEDDEVCFTIMDGPNYTYTFRNLYMMLPHLRLPSKSKLWQMNTHHSLLPYHQPKIRHF
jgi:hypothetical protein